MYNISYIFLLFIIYSIIGYISEVIYCSYMQKKFVNRGFMFGIICPIYGIGSVLAIYCLSSFKDNPVILFILGMLITSTLEYYTSYVFEKIFHNKWWDYSYRPDNINGRICLRNSIFFGLGILIIIYIVNPFITNILNSFESNLIIIISIIIFIIFIIDLIWSISIAYNLKSRLIVAEELKAYKLKLIPKLFEKMHMDELIKIRYKGNRLIKNYPDLAKDLRKELNIVKEMIIETRNVKKKKKTKNVKFE